jgi:hypothetical protein
MDIQNLLGNLMTPQTISQLSQNIGGADPNATAQATEGILHSLLNAVNKNAQNEEGASNLQNALSKDHDGSLLDNLSDFLQGNTGGLNPSAINGAGILKHMLGDKQSSLLDLVSSNSGLNNNQTANLMTTLAPIVMGFLGRQQASQPNAGGSGIAGLLGNLVQSQLSNSSQNSSNPLIGMATKFLDKDGDGSILDDLAGGLGNMFKK